MDTGNSYRDTIEDGAAQEETCGFCLKALQDKARVARAQNCKHEFCFECAKNWANRRLRNRSDIIRTSQVSEII